jgi:predicted molibdopterin-dependent oxidoreductase YjgC
VRRFGEGRYYISSSGTPGDYLCRYGRFGYELFVKRKRVRRAEVRRGSERENPDLCDAQRLVSSEMKRIAEKYGPERVAVFVSPELTNEEMYLAVRIARDGLGTNNIGSLSILGTHKKAGALDEYLGFTASTSDRSSLRDADLIICNNTALEADHQVLAVEVIRAAKAGAKLIVANSALGRIDRLISTIAMDPMRGTASVLWNAVIQALIEDGHLTAAAIEDIPGGKDFLKDRDVTVEDAAEQSGIDAEDIRKAAAIVRDARKVVFVHSADRLQDMAPGDIETLAAFVTILRAAGVEADLILPRIIANSAGLELMGADPAFAAGRVPVPAGIKGARDRNELREMLEAGEIRAAFIIGEDPMAWGRTGKWLENVEFLAAMDWTPTETTQYADAVLPGSTFLETAGTRCNFEGNLVEFAAAVEPPAGLSGIEVLKGLAAEFGIKTTTDITGEIDGLVRKSLGSLACFYWNTGQDRAYGGQAKVGPTGAGVKTVPIQPPLTHAEKYKKEIREVGTERYRVRS